MGRTEVMGAMRGRKAIILAALAVTACAGPTGSPPPAAPAVTVAPATPASPVPDLQGFARWKADFRAQALAAGIHPATLDATLPGLTLLPRVIELDHRQPEGSVSFATYARHIVSAERIKRGRALIHEQGATLTMVEARYGVPARYLVALWGMESSFGRAMGSFHVLDSLATLAYDGRRADFFRQELVAALRIVQETGVRPDQMKGSWAGAMGQVQFMPSTYLKYARDFDGCGRADIWERVPDVLASAANYLASIGWKPGQSWGREVRLPPKGLGALATGLDHPRSLTRWRRAGVRAVDGRPLPAGDRALALVLPDGPGGRAFLVGENFRVLMRWNRSTYFATAVGLLADRLGAGA